MFVISKLYVNLIISFFFPNSMAKFEVHVTGTVHFNNISDSSAVPENIYPHPTPEGLVEISVRWGGGGG